MVSRDALIPQSSTWLGNWAGCAPADMLAQVGMFCALQPPGRVGTFKVCSTCQTVSISERCCGDDSSAA